MKKFFVLFAVLSLSLSLNAQPSETRLMRFPAISNEQVVFSYAGDLYTVGTKGGEARRLTSHDGYEMFARFSPDGKQIAFTAHYDGNTEVYLMPANGGIPQRLTYTTTLGRDDISDRQGPNNIVMTWKNDTQIVYRSREHSFNAFKGKLRLANVNGGLSEELPLPVGSWCSYNADQSKMAYNRVFREFRTWKYYQGGMADDIWIYDFKTKKIENITNNNTQDIMPMWVGDYIYFLSDRDRIMNLFVYNTQTKQTKKVTDFKEYDIKFPSLGNQKIIFENGGFIYVFDIQTQKTEKLTIYINEDFASSRSLWKNVSGQIAHVAPSYDGKRVVVSARGDIYSVPVKSGITQNLTQTSSAHERVPQWSPNGRYIAYIGDASGEDEIYLLDMQNPNQKPVQLTKNADTYKFDFKWSPDGKKIAFHDQMKRLQFTDIETQKTTIVQTSKDAEINDYNWSPDSKWLTYTFPEKENMNRIYLYELANKKNTPVTDHWYSCNSPNFSSDGKYLLFASARDFNPTFSHVESNYVYRDMSRVYLLTLSKQTPSPLLPVNDVVMIQETDNNAPKSEIKNSKSNTKDAGMIIDLDGITDRIVALPVESGNYYNIHCIDGLVYYQKIKNGGYTCIFNLKDQKETVLWGCRGFSIADGNKYMMVAMGGKYYMIDLPKSKTDLKDPVDFQNMKTIVDLKAEWSQIYEETWRQMKYFFYDADMHGVDWNKIHDKYSILVPYANERNDLNYILGEMIGELNCGHAYVGGGDRKNVERVQLGLLGAKISRDASGYYKIDEILKGENWRGGYRSPLTEPGIDARNGDFVIAVDGKSTKQMNDIFEAFVGKAGVQVELTLNTAPNEQGARKMVIVPIDNDANLYYYQWVQNNIDKVNKATNGEVGYIHIPDMGSNGLNEFVQHFYPQLSKKALIIDDRGNGGGNVSPMIIERLHRELVYMRVARNTAPYPGGLAAQYGPKCLLIDQYSASDGDLFPYQFKELKMGKLIGVRTWGGVVGIRGSLPIMDGGYLNKPEYAHFDKDGKQFIIEGYGVEPDIFIDNDPAKEYAGEDQQLDKAIELMLQELKNNPVNLPEKAPEYPKK